MMELATVQGKLVEREEKLGAKEVLLVEARQEINVLETKKVELEGVLGVGAEGRISKSLRRFPFSLSLFRRYSHGQTSGEGGRGRESIWA